MPGNFIMPGATATCEAPGLTTSVQNLGADCSMAVQINSKTSSTSLNITAYGKCDRGVCIGNGGSLVSINANIKPAGCTPNCTAKPPTTPDGCGGLCP